MYIIKSQTTNQITLSEDLKSVRLEVTVTFNKEGEKVLRDGSVGYSVELSLESGDRASMVAELNSKVNEQFQKQYKA